MIAIGKHFISDYFTTNGEQFVLSSVHLWTDLGTDV